MDGAAATRTWRVRGWVRGLSVLMPVLFLAPVIWPATSTPPGPAGCPPTNTPGLASSTRSSRCAPGAAFRSRMDLDDDQIIVVNPWATTTLDRREVVDVTPGGRGTELHRVNNRPVIVFAV